MGSFLIGFRLRYCISLCAQSNLSCHCRASCHARSRASGRTAGKTGAHSQLQGCEKSARPRPDAQSAHRVSQRLALRERRMVPSGRLQIREQQSPPNDGENRKVFSQTTWQTCARKSGEAFGANQINDSSSAEERCQDSGGESCGRAAEKSDPDSSAANGHALVNRRLFVFGPLRISVRP